MGRFRIYASSVPGSGRSTLNASLLDASTNEVIRQTRIELTPDLTPIPRSLIFPGYDVPNGQSLRLQLQVPEDEASYVVYGLADSQTGQANVTFGGVADAGDGPLAFAHLASGSGLRAAIVGEQAQRIRLLLSAGFVGLAFVLSPSVLAASRKARGVGTKLIRGPTAWARSLGRRIFTRDADSTATASRGFLSVPWYPWVIASAPILHFLASNRPQFDLIEAVGPLIVASAVVSVGIVGLRTVLNDWHRPAVAAGATTTIFFSYGHVRSVLDPRVDDALLFSIAVVSVLAAVGAVVRSGNGPRRWTQFLNLSSAVLLVFPLANLVVASLADREPQSLDDHTALSESATRLFPEGLPDTTERRPDIYYIVLDEYGRHDTLGDFDNSHFLGELERRGFYIAREATGNYASTASAIASILNLTYIDSLRPQNALGNPYWLSPLTQYHAVGSILKALGYTYVHLASGFEWTNIAPLADVLVTFTPQGIGISTGGNALGAGRTVSDLLTGPFVRELVHTTALQPVIGHFLTPPPGAPYDWYHPGRTLQTFEFLSNPIDVRSPKFVFAHIIKPHYPYNFDRHGNVYSDIGVHRGFDDAHDPSVPNAYIGQLIYTNTRVLEVVDAILSNYDRGDDPVIVISSDHGRRDVGQGFNFKVLAAYYLPDVGVEKPLYTSISMVNQFRVIFDYLFDWKLGLLEDKRA